MSDPVPSPSPSAAPGLQPGQVVIRGKLMNQRRYVGPQGASYFCLVVMPAPDAYSSPATVEIQSPTRLGETEEEITCLCQVGGFPRTYQAKDRETGEISTVRTADVKLRAVPR